MPPQVGAWDLRGLLPARSLRRFLSWFRSGAYREGSGDCLRRELVEEMDEVGLPPAGDGLGELEFTHVRTVSEGPDAVPGKHYRQLRRFEVFDLVTGAGGGLHLARRLLSAGVSAEHPDVVCASRADIRHGRVGRLLVAPQSAFLMGSSRLAPDLPPIR